MRNRPVFECPKCGTEFDYKNEAELCAKLHDYVRVEFVLDVFEGEGGRWTESELYLEDFEDFDASFKYDHAVERLERLCAKVGFDNLSILVNSQSTLYWSLVCLIGHEKEARARITEAVHAWMGRIKHKLEDSDEKEV